MTRFAFVLLLGLALACSESSTPGDGGPSDSATPDSAAPDSATPDGSAPDSATPDSATPDSATPDSATPDTTTPFDSGIEEPLNHRVEAIPCDNVRPSPPIEPFGGGGCTTHEECVDGDNGRCTTYPRGFTQCTYDECFDDSTCGSSLCFCENPQYGGANTCLSGNCQIDADCGAGNYCSPSFGSCGNYSGVVTYYCHTVDDECTNDSDCGDPSSYCRFTEEVGHWVCSNSQCVG